MSNFIRVAYGVVNGAGVDTSDMTTDEVIKKFKELSGGKDGWGEKAYGDRKTSEEVNKEYGNRNSKKKQLEIILKENPATDNYHTWIREEKDIKTFEEAIKSNIEEGFDEENPSAYPDVTGEMIKKALEIGTIKVYSSKPIKQGIFVTPSKMQAMDYSGGKQPYESTIRLEDVAWINIDEGQVAKVESKNETEDSRIKEYAKQTGLSYASAKRALLEDDEDFTKKWEMH